MTLLGSRLETKRTSLRHLQVYEDQSRTVMRGLPLPDFLAASQVIVKI